MDLDGYPSMLAPTLPGKGVLPENMERLSSSNQDESTDIASAGSSENGLTRVSPPGETKSTRGRKPAKTRSGNAENQARYRARCKAKKSSLEEEYRQTKEALLSERVSYARLKLDSSVLSGLLRVRDEVIEALEGSKRDDFPRGPLGQRSDSLGPANSVMVEVIPRGLTRSLHEMVISYLQVVEGMFHDLCVEEGGEPSMVQGIEFPYESMLALGDEMQRMSEATYLAASQASVSQAAELLREYEATGSRLALLRMMPLWQRMATVHIVGTAVRPDLIRAQMIGPPPRMLTDDEREELRKRLTLTTRQISVLQRVHRHHLAVLAAVSAEQISGWRQAAAALSTAVRPRESMGSMMEGYLSSLQAAASLEKYADILFAVSSSYCRQLFSSLSVEQSMRWMVAMPKSFSETTAFAEFILRRHEEEKVHGDEDSSGSVSLESPIESEQSMATSLCAISQWLDVPHGERGMLGLCRPVIITNANDA